MPIHRAVSGPVAGQQRRALPAVAFLHLHLGLFLSSGRPDARHPGHERAPVQREFQLVRFRTAGALQSGGCGAGGADSRCGLAQGDLYARVSRSVHAKALSPNHVREILPCNPMLETVTRHQRGFSFRRFSCSAGESSANSRKLSPPWQLRLRMQVPSCRISPTLAACGGNISHWFCEIVPRF